MHLYMQAQLGCHTVMPEVNASESITSVMSLNQVSQDTTQLVENLAKGAEPSRGD